MELLRHRARLLPVMLGSLCILASSANAEPDATTVAKADASARSSLPPVCESTTLVTKPSVSRTFKIPVDQPYVVRFKSPVISVGTRQGWKVKVFREKTGDEVELYAPKGSTARDIRGIAIFKLREYTLTGHVRKATAKDGVVDGCFVDHDLDKGKAKLAQEHKAAMDEKDKKHAEAMAAKERQHAEIMARKDARIKELQAEPEQLAREIVRKKSREGIAELTLGPKPIYVERGDLRIHALRARKFGHDLLVDVAVENRGEPDFQLKDVQAFYQDMKLNRAAGVTFELPQPPPDDIQAAGATFEPPQPPDDIVAVVPGRQTIEGVVTVADVGNIIEPDELDLHFIGAESAGPIVLSVSEWRPVGKEELEREKRARQTIVGVTGTFGAFWIADGLGANRLEPTRFQGFGARLVKGINEMVAVEVELSGGFTGTARFPNMTIEGTEGELTRSASFGRAGFGGLLRFGDKFTPYLRLGVAGQGTSFDAAFSSSVDMDESSFELTALLTFGGGMAVRLGDNLLAGVAVSLETPLGGGNSDLFGRAFSFGGQIAYGW